MPRHGTEENDLGDLARRAHSTAFGVEDSFFELGGHSLVTMQVASRVRERLGIDMPLAALFEHVTIAELAAWIDQRLAGKPSAALASIPRMPRGGPLPVSLSQRRMWVIQQFDPASVAYNVAVTLRLRGALDRELLQRSLDALVERHEGLRTHFVMHDGEPAQVIRRRRRAGRARRSADAAVRRARGRGAVRPARRGRRRLSSSRRRRCTASRWCASAMKTRCCCGCCTMPSPTTGRWRS